MTVVLPPFLLVFDLSTLLASQASDWQRFSTIGECYVPQAVLDTLQDLGDRASEPEVATTAKEFLRFFPASGWVAATHLAHHFRLQPTPGHNLSRKARLALTVAQVTYGLTQQRPDALVMLIANDQGLLRQLRSLDAPNLCGMPLAALVQWSRTQRKPPVVMHQLHVLRSTTSHPDAITSSRSLTSATARSTSPRSSSARSTSPTPSLSSPSTAKSGSVRSSNLGRSSGRSAVRPSPAASPTSTGSRLRLTWIGLVVGAIVVLVGWRVLAPENFDRVWRSLPGQERRI